MTKIKHFSRYKDIAVLFIKHGRFDLAKHLGTDYPTDKANIELTGDARELAKDLQELGPTFVKLGQVLSTQIDFLPESYQQALSELQDQADPFPFEEVEKIIHEELGVKIKDAFQEFDIEPIAAASLSQVHHAILHSGKSVAVKIQRPHIQEKVIEDLDALEELARFFDQHAIFGKHYFWEEKIGSFRNTMLNELDFLKEAHNLKIFARNLQEFERITVPHPIDDYTTSKVLTMEFIKSRKITKFHPLERMEIDGDLLARDLFRAYLKQMFVDGFVHIDPHPGNVYLTDNKNIAFLDLGMVERIPPHFQLESLKLLLGIAEGKGEEVADTVIKLGHQGENFQYYKFQEEIADLVVQQKNMSWKEMGIGKLLIKMAHAGNKWDLRLPPKFNTLGKTLMNLDGIVQLLSPDFNPNQFIRENIEPILTKRLRSGFSKENLIKLFFELGDTAYQLPAKINTFVDLLSKNELKLKIQTHDEKEIKTYEKIGNRIAFGLITSALILAGALIYSHNVTLSLVPFVLAGVLFFIFVLNLMNPKE